VQQLSGQDAAMLYVESPEAPNHVTGLYIYDPATAPSPVSFARILETISSRLAFARAFRQRLVRVPFDLDNPYWIEGASFDLEFHVRQLRLPEPGNWRQLCTQVARLQARPLDLSRPPWELYVIEGLDQIEGIPAGCFAIVLKVHHSAIDGAAGVAIVNAIHDLSPLADPPPATDTWRADTEPSPLSLLLGAGLHAVARPPRFVRQLGRTVPIVGRLPLQVGRGDFSLPPVTLPHTRFNGKVMAHRVMDARTFPFESIRAIKKSVEGATVNDVALAIVAGTMRRYLLAKGELPEASLGAACPVSLRSRDQTQAMTGNDVGMMSVPLHTDIEDPMARLKAIVQSAANAKERKRAIGARTLVEFSELLPGALLGFAFRAQSRILRRTKSALLFNTAVTNVPASPVPIYFAGAKMVATYGLGPVADGMGILHLVCSYAGQIGFTVTADREMLPDPDFYAACLQESYEELLSAHPRHGFPSRKRSPRHSLSRIGQNSVHANQTI
jgi:diacylglycerol O-acyltransferase